MFSWLYFFSILQTKSFSVRSLFHTFEIQTVRFDEIILQQCEKVETLISVLVIFLFSEKFCEIDWTRLIGQNKVT